MAHSRLIERCSPVKATLTESETRELAHRSAHPVGLPIGEGPTEVTETSVCIFHRRFRDYGFPWTDPDAPLIFT